MAPALRLPTPALRSPLLELPWVGAASAGAQDIWVVYMFTYQNHPAGPGCPAGPRGGPRGGLTLLVCPQDTATSLPPPVHAPSARWACTDMSPRSCFMVAPRIQALSARQLRLEAAVWPPRAHHPPPRRSWL